ncbi:MAG: hypothetical protein ACYDAQ_02025, partial [Mycobacteriales bacterium]
MAASALDSGASHQASHPVGMAVGLSSRALEVTTGEALLAGDAVGVGEAAKVGPPATEGTALTRSNSSPPQTPAASATRASTAALGESRLRGRGGEPGPAASCRTEGPPARAGESRGGG